MKINSKKDSRFLSELLSKLGYDIAWIGAEELEDIAFGKLLKRNLKRDVLPLQEAKSVYGKLPKRK